MKKTLLSITIALTLSGCAAVGSGARYDDAMFTLRTNSIASVNQMAASVVAFLSTGTEEQVIEKAKTTVSNGLRDPGSAQFRNVRVVPYQIGKVVCGEVNGKNAYGGYTGLKTHSYVLRFNDGDLTVISRVNWIGQDRNC